MVAPIPRLPDWRARFSSFITDCRGQPFERGVHDCALYMADGVFAQTGVDIAADFRGRYKTLGGADRALKKYGAGDLESTVAVLLPEIDPVRARLGDVVIFDQPEGLTCGFRLTSIVSAVTPAGLGEFGLDLVTRAFKVGE